jgi:hypothetical protein
MGAQTYVAAEPQLSRTGEFVLFVGEALDLTLGALSLAQAFGTGELADKMIESNNFIYSLHDSSVRHFGYVSRAKTIIASTNQMMTMRYGGTFE